MRERLIELIGAAIADCDCMECQECEYELGDYCLNKRVADYLIDNGVIVLPCKVGSRVYFITKTNEILDTTLDDLNTCYEFRNLIGTGFYLTKEEAEKALAELKGGE